MVSKRKLSKSDARGENPIIELPEAKKSRISDNKKPSAQDGVVEDGGVLVELLRTSGITLKTGESQNEIAVDQATFQKKLSQMLKKHPFYPHVVQDFISGLESHIQDRDLFRNCLLPCAPTRSEGARIMVHSYCESLMKLLLGIEILQEH
ncbi:hypothetical protein Y1Q_0013002 [Alligator mississippiensis]|uniref:Uncharacterized protein n=1 Tax=Alligator mississippiensis TaxID=8496 RepID=A0A151MTG4_ALLMI|nr:hypothetical protein Y1Q_0013002 [Alligator mississippiensis]